MPKMSILCTNLQFSKILKISSKNGILTLTITFKKCLGSCFNVRSIKFIQNLIINFNPSVCEFFQIHRHLR